MGKFSLLRYVCLLSGIGFVVATLPIASYAQGSLDDRLAAIEKANTGAVDLTAFENSCLELLTTFKTPEDMGKVYARIADVLIMKGTKIARTKGIDYCEKAVKSPLDIEVASRVYSLWGWMLSQTPVGPHEKSKEEYAKARPAVVTIYMKGLMLLLDNNIPLVYPPMSGVTMAPVSSTDPAVIEKRNREVAAMKQAERVGRLVRYRRLFEAEIAGTYSKSPHATDELRRIAGDILKDHKDVVDDLVARVESNINHPPAITVAPKEQAK
jgi:hypothetical protein